MSHTVGSTTTNYTWDANRPVPQVLQDGTNTYVYGLGLISSTDGSGVQTYYDADGLGSTSDLTNSSATQTDGYTYDAFGAATHSPGSSTQPFQFTGQQTDADSGLQYLRARYYDPSTGRLLGRDPFPGLTSVPATQNPYAYALNNPATLSDPTGRYSVMDLLTDLRPDFTCSLAVSLSNFGCIGDFLNAISEYNEFVFDFLGRFATLNCLSAGLALSAVLLPTPAGGLLLGAYIGYQFLGWTTSTAINASQIDTKEGVSFSNASSGGAALADFVALQAFKFSLSGRYGTAAKFTGYGAAAISSAQCLSDVIGG
jgi:RHS repeat-associated protein